LEYD